MSDDGSFIQVNGAVMMFPSGSALSSPGTLEIPMLKPGALPFAKDNWLNMAGVTSFVRIASDGKSTIAGIEDASLKIRDDGACSIAIWIDAGLASCARILVHVPMAVKYIGWA